MIKKILMCLMIVFIWYLFIDKGGENVLLDFINVVMISADMKTFKSVEIFYLKVYY